MLRPVLLLLLSQGAFGSEAALGPLDENDADAEEGDAEAMEEGEEDDLTAAMARTHL